MKVDENTSIPLGLVMTMFGTLLAATGAGSAWVASWTSNVDFRLQQIENKLAIPPLHSRVHDKEVHHRANSERLHEPVPVGHSHRRLPTSADLGLGW